MKSGINFRVVPGLCVLLLVACIPGAKAFSLSESYNSFVNGNGHYRGRALSGNGQYGGGGGGGGGGRAIIGNPDSAGNLSSL